MRLLFPSYAPPDKWRNDKQSKRLEGDAWQAIRKKILIRDNYTCQYCGYKSEKYQIIHHFDWDPKNNKDENFCVICQMCNLIEHAGQGVALRKVVDLYKESKYNQNEIIIITREMRDKGKSDGEIIIHLGLKDKAEFKMDRDYLKKLFGFVTSRRAVRLDSKGEMYNNWLAYHNRFNKKV